MKLAIVTTARHARHIRDHGLIEFPRAVYESSPTVPHRVGSPVDVLAPTDDVINFCEFQKVPSTSIDRSGNPAVVRDIDGSRVRLLSHRELAVADDLLAVAVTIDVPGPLGVEYTLDEGVVGLGSPREVWLPEDVANRYVDSVQFYAFAPREAEVLRALAEAGA